MKEHANKITVETINSATLKRVLSNDCFEVKGLVFPRKKSSKMLCLHEERENVPGTRCFAHF